MSHVYVIAEAGVNHNGKIELAKQLIDEAAKAGADAIKFQTFKADKLVTKNAEKAMYQKNETDKNESQYDMIKRLELKFEDHSELIDYAESKNIQFLSSGFDLDSLEFLNDIGVSIFKVPSGEITNLPYLRKIASFGKPIILSTGMSDNAEILDALKVLRQSGGEEITILHCNTEYPTPMSDVNLLAMKSIEKEFGCKVGYSDHTLGIEVPIAAVALGAEIIEKHFTLDKQMDGPDHKASLEPVELKDMVSSIRNIEKALGDGIKKPSVSESKNKIIARKSIVAKVEISKGSVFTEENLSVKRPGNGLSPMKWDQVIGESATRDYEPDEMIEL